MAIATEKAYEILNLPLGSSKDAIEQSYKKLAVKWHPEKYTTAKNTQEALKNFKLINIAYRKLIHNERDDKDITLHEMFEQYRQVFRGENNKKNKQPVAQPAHTTYVDIKNNSILTDNNSTLLLELNNNTNYKNNKNLINHNNNNLNGFGHHNSKSNNSNNNSNNVIKNTYDKNNNDEENYENQYHNGTIREDLIEQNILSIKLKVKNLAMKGNELAKQGEYSKAIEKFTEALKYDTSDHRLYGNRSYCYDKLNCFNEALSDAENAVVIEPSWPKGYFRKGRALFGLKMYKEAEQAYEKVLEIEFNDDTEFGGRIIQVQISTASELVYFFSFRKWAFSKSQAESAVRNYGSVQACLESLCHYSKSDNKSIESCSDIDNNELDYNENDSDNGDLNSDSIGSTNKKLQSISISNTLINGSTNNKQTYDGEGKNSSGVQPASTSLWIGNVDPNVTEEILNEMFSAYGQLSNVRCLPEKYCAFVNFKLKEDAYKAMQNLQGKLLEGQRLLIKYPDNPNTAILGSLVAKSQNIKINEPNTSNGTITINNKKIVTTNLVDNSTKLKNKKSDNGSSSSDHSKVQTSNASAAAAAAAAAAADSQKLTGPVNGNECYFWRTTGCLYADKCRYEHIKKNKGIDKKPWHK